MGVVEDFPAERLYRDARITEIYGGVTDVQMKIVADQLRKEYGL
jgi:butyryl-CoA dehydrogenase